MWGFSAHWQFGTSSRASMSFYRISFSIFKYLSMFHRNRCNTYSSISLKNHLSLAVFPSRACASEVCRGCPRMDLVPEPGFRSGNFVWEEDVIWYYSICMYVHIYIYIHVCVYVNIYIYIFIFIPKGTKVLRWREPWGWGGVGMLAFVVKLTWKLRLRSREYAGVGWGGDVSLRCEVDMEVDASREYAGVGWGGVGWGC